MRENPYQAPSVEVQDPETSEWKWRPPVVGGFVSIGVFYALSIVISPLLQHIYTAQGVPYEKLYEEMTTSVGGALLWHLVMIIGLVAGGYIAASSAIVKPLLAAASSAGVLLVLLPLQNLGVYPNPFPLWSQVLGFLTPLPSALFGGWLFCTQRPAK